MPLVQPGGKKKKKGRSGIVEGKAIYDVYRRMSIKVKLNKDRRKASSQHHPVEKIWGQRTFKEEHQREVRVQVTGT